MQRLWFHEPRNLRPMGRGRLRYEAQRSAACARRAHTPNATRTPNPWQLLSLSGLRQFLTAARVRHRRPLAAPLLVLSPKRPGELTLFAALPPRCVCDRARPCGWPRGHGGLVAWRGRRLVEREAGLDTRRADGLRGAPGGASKCTPPVDTNPRPAALPPCHTMCQVRPRHTPAAPRHTALHAPRARQPLGSADGSALLWHRALPLSCRPSSSSLSTPRPRSGCTATSSRPCLGTCKKGRTTKRAGVIFSIPSAHLRVRPTGDASYVQTSTQTESNRRAAHGHRTGVVSS